MVLHSAVVPKCFPLNGFKDRLSEGKCKTRSVQPSRCGVVSKEELAGKTVQIDATRSRFNPKLVPFFCMASNKVSAYSLRVTSGRSIFR